jgi:NADPH:quinone reductase-like Zn-dependent oxidoreductase
VIATASAGNAGLVAELGASKVIDYRKDRFEDEVEPVDVVFDTVGGETLERSWALLKPGGRMVTIAANAEGVTEQRVKDAFFIVEPSREQLEEIGGLLDSGELKTFVNAVVPFEEAAEAYANLVPKRLGYGKVVVSVA